MPLICIITIKFVVITDLSMDAHLIIWRMLPPVTSTHSLMILFVRWERERYTRVYLNCKGVEKNNDFWLCVCVCVANVIHIIQYIFVWHNIMIGCVFGVRAYNLYTFCQVRCVYVWGRQINNVGARWMALDRALCETLKETLRWAKEKGLFYDANRIRFSISMVAFKMERVCLCVCLHCALY